MSETRIIHLASGKSVGVAERYAHDVCCHFLGKGMRAEVVTRDVRSVDAFFNDSGIHTLHAPLRGVPDPGSAIFLAGELRKTPADTRVVIHAFRYRDAFTALLARKIARRKDVRVIVTRHFAQRARNTALYRRVYRNIDAHIFVSRLARDRFLSAWPKGKQPFPSQRLHVMRFSLNTPPLDFPLPEPEKGPVTAMFHGPIVPGEGLETLIDAMAILRGSRIRLRITGSGNPDYADRLRERAMARHVMENIDWKIGRIESDDDFKECHFGVLPADKEAVAGYHNIMFMAAGRPHVATRIGAPAEYLTDREDALLVNPGNATALAEAMLQMATDVRLRSNMAAKALAHYNSRLAWPRFIGRLEKLYLG